MRGRDLKADMMEYYMREYYLKKIEALSPLYIGLLRFLSFPVDCFAELGIKPEDIKDHDFSRTLQAYFRDVPFNVLKGVFGDLYHMGFTNTDRSIFDTLTAGSGVDIISGRVSSLGEDFMKFCTLEHEK